LVVAVTLLFSAVTIDAAVKLDGLNVVTFGTAIKNGHLYATEETIFQHQSATGGVVTEMWMTGGWDGFAYTRVRIYIDGESEASIDYQLYMAHGIGWGDDSTWQGNEWVGKTAHGGGVYNTFRIPFSKSIIVTAQLAYPTNNVFWFIIRGLENMPVIIGDLQLPAGTRLYLLQNQNVTLQPYELTTLAQIPQGNAGLLFFVTIEAESSDLNFLEACFRAYIDGAEDPQFLSSGTEDFFFECLLLQWWPVHKFTSRFDTF